MAKTLEEQGIEGEYVCKHCKLVYCVYGDRHRCDICNRKLRFICAEELKELEGKWDSKEKSAVMVR